MNRIAWFLPVLVVTLVAWGCCPSARDPVPEGGGASPCGGCDLVKGSDDCSKPDAMACDGCDLIKGSPGCCTLEKGTDVALCTKCGQIAGSDDCCKPDAVKCEECGLAVGSPGCCRIGT